MKDYYDLTSEFQADPQVRLYQLRLNSIRNRYHQNWDILDPDGIYGPKTKNVVAKFQECYGLTPVSGILGPTTAKKIVEIDSQGLIYHTTVSPNPGKGGILPTELFQIKAEEIVGSIASFLKDISDAATQETSNTVKLGNVKHGDVNRIINSMVNRPDVVAMRKEIEKKVWDDLVKKSHGNTNVVNYNKSKQALDTVKEIGDAKRMVSLGKTGKQFSAVVDNMLFKDVIDLSVKELDSANIGKRISEGLKSPKAGGAILTTLSLFPLAKHFIEFCWRAIHHEPVKETIVLVVKDIISFAVGILIGLIIGAIVGLIGLTGGVAVVAVIAVGIIVGVIISVLFPNWEGNVATTLVNWIKNTADDIARDSELASQYNGLTYCQADYYPQAQRLKVGPNPYYNPISYIK